MRLLRRSCWDTRLLLLALIPLAAAACVRKPIPAPTAMNPESFPQPAPPAAPAETAPQEIPPLVTENQAFITINGIPLYRIGPGDLLEILVTRGATQEKFQTYVRSSGKIPVLLVEVAVDGLTAEQAAAEITRELSVFFRRPAVEVQVKEHNSKKVTVLGAVGSLARASGYALPLTGRVTIFELIHKAGGFHANAAMDRVRITRASGKTYNVNLFQYMQEGDATQTAILDAGDTVFVPERVLGEEQRVFLLGEVEKPGPVPFYPKMTAAQMVASAGGWKDTAKFREARVIRGDPRNPEIIALDLQRLVLNGDLRIDQYLRPNDVVFIPRTPVGDWNQFIAQLKPTLELISLFFQPFLLYEALTD